jgi:hypothetical protein
MTDRIRQITVTLDRDYRDDDAEAALTAIRMIRGVADASPIALGNGSDQARWTVRIELRQKLVQAVLDVLDGKF